MNRDDAEEFTQSLGQIVGGSWRQIALAKRLGVPKALGLGVEDWVNQRLGGYIRMTVEDRRKAAAELAADGASTREIAEVIGVSKETARRDLEPATNVADSDLVEPEIATNVAPNVAPLDAVAALAVDHSEAALAKRLTDKRDAKLAKRVEREARKAVAATAGSTRPKSSNADLRVLSCAQLTTELSPASVDWIITDPPYPREFLGVYDDLAVLAHRTLKPGGLLLAMVGQSYLPEIMQSLSSRLTYHWTLAYLTPGGQAVQIHPRKVNAFWKPVLVYSTGDYAGRWFGDVAKSAVNANEKDDHHWGQSVSGMADLLARFVSTGDVVVDPFLGGGTTGVAALAHGCRFVGCDVDEDCINVAAARINGTQDAAA